jgi:O-antigen ligase
MGVEMAKLMIKGPKGHNIDIINLLFFVLGSFICFSAGTDIGYQYRYQAVLILLGVCIIKILFQGRIKYDGAKIYLFCIAIGIFISAYSSYDRAVTIRYALIFMCISIFFFCETDEKFWGIFLKITWWIAAIVAISVIISSVAPSIITNYFWFIVGQNKVYSILTKAAGGQFSGLAAEIAEAACIINFGLAIEYSKLFTNKKVNKTNIFWIVIFFISLILTTKRTLFAIAVFMLLMCIFMTQKNVKKRLQYFIIFLAMGGVLLILMQIVPQLQTLGNRFSGNDYESMDGRSVLWQYSFQMIKEKPLFGYGYGSYNAFANSHGLSYWGGNWVANGHNAYLQLFGETGILGGLLILIPLIYSLCIGIFYIMKKQIQLEDKRRLIFCVYIQIMFFIYGITGNTLVIIQQIVLWFFVIDLSHGLIKKYRLGEKNK